MKMSAENKLIATVFAFAVIWALFCFACGAVFFSLNGDKTPLKKEKVK